MRNDSIISYILKSFSEKKSEAEIRNNLQQAGWSDLSIDEGIREAKNSNSVPTPTSDVPRPRQISTMWDAFEHVLMFISLYIMSASFALLLHEFVNKWAPAPTLNPGSLISIMLNPIGLDPDAIDYSIKFNLASLIVSFPFFAYFHLNISKRVIKNPALHNIKIRKQLIYFTLIVTFLFIVKKIIETITILLNGNLSLNFMFHLLVTVGVSIIIFVIYLHQVKEDRKSYA